MRLAGLAGSGVFPVRGRADGASNGVLQTLRLVPKLLLHRGTAGIRGRRSDAVAGHGPAYAGIVAAFFGAGRALACSGSVAAGIKARELGVKAKQNEWVDRFLGVPWPFRAGLDTLIPFLAQDLRVPWKRMRRNGDQ